MPSIQLGIGPSKQLAEVDKKRKVPKEKRKSFEGFNFCVEVLEFGLQRHVLLPVGFRQKKTYYSFCAWTNYNFSSLRYFASILLM